MERILPGGYTELIEVAMSILPSPIQRRIEYAHWFVGSDPIFAGLHDYKDIDDGRSYRDTAHVVHPFQQICEDKRTTIVIPKLIPLHSAVHEIGHVVHETLKFRPHVMPVTDYARVDEFEAFAEAFTAFFFYNYAQRQIDEKTEALLQMLMDDIPDWEAAI